MKTILYFLLILFILYSCKGIDCSELSKFDRETQCIIIVKNIPDDFSGAYFKIEGKSIKTGKDTVYNEENRWFCDYYGIIKIGDTIVKHKGELIFSIHKKDTVLNFNWECEGKVYK